ncbi:MAG: peptidylprolyl isomerase [bacterium]|nr:peptidylprolyl isomerase [bacterium]
MKIENGNTVVVEYTGTFDNGEVFDSSEGKPPFEFKVGEGKVIKGFEKAILGMQKGEEKTVTINPDDAYGERNDKLTQDVPKKVFPEKLELKKDMVLHIKDPKGMVLPLKIMSVNKDTVKVDMNHPLAGKKLTFKFKIVDIKK